MSICIVDECFEESRVKGACLPHYSRFMKYGSYESRGLRGPKAGPSRTSIILIEDIHYVAGIIEGEGYFHKNSAALRIIVEMTDKDTLEYLQKITHMGRISKPLLKINQKHNTTWTWTVSKRGEVARLLLAIYPLMSLRRKQQIKIGVDKLYNTHKEALRG